MQQIALTGLEGQIIIVDTWRIKEITDKEDHAVLTLSPSSSLSFSDTELKNEYLKVANLPGQILELMGVKSIPEKTRPDNLLHKVVMVGLGAAMGYLLKNGALDDILGGNDDKEVPEEEDDEYDEESYDNLNKVKAKMEEFEELLDEEAPDNEQSQRKIELYKYFVDLQGIFHFGIIPVRIQKAISDLVSIHGPIDQDE